MYVAVTVTEFESSDGILQSEFKAWSARRNWDELLETLPDQASSLAREVDGEAHRMNTTSADAIMPVGAPAR